VCWQHAVERRIDQLADRANVIRHADLHRRRNPRCFVGSAKIVVCDVERNGRDMVLQFFENALVNRVNRPWCILNVKLCRSM
jgi:hypothetical protein